MPAQDVRTVMYEPSVCITVPTWLYSTILPYRTKYCITRHHMLDDHSHIPINSWCAQVLHTGGRTRPRAPVLRVPGGHLCDAPMDRPRHALPAHPGEACQTQFYGIAHSLLST